MTVGPSPSAPASTHRHTLPTDLRTARTGIFGEGIVARAASVIEIASTAHCAFRLNLQCDPQNNQVSLKSKVQKEMLMQTSWLFGDLTLATVTELISQGHLRNKNNQICQIGSCSITPFSHALKITIAYAINVISLLRGCCNSDVRPPHASGPATLYRI